MRKGKLKTVEINCESDEHVILTKPKFNNGVEHVVFRKVEWDRVAVWVNGEKGFVIPMTELKEIVEKLESQPELVAV